MEKLQNIAKDLLISGKAKIIIGFRNGLDDKAIPVFVSLPEKTNLLVWDERCKQNLTNYLYKQEVVKFEKVAIVVNPAGVRTIVQLLSEHQLKNIELTAIAISHENEITVLSNAEEFENYALNHLETKSEADKILIEKLLSLPREQRWEYWINQLSACIKCYACRAACPLCYCNRCAIEENRPQWINITSGGLANVEWHISHAMHLAGRCVNCGECGRVCPVGIPVSIFTVRINDELEQMFGQRSGMKVKQEYALNSFKVEDKEHFIM